MALAALNAPTWGISGPTFLLAYVVIAAAVGVAGVRTRRALAEPATTSPAGDLTTRPHDLAYLTGGADLAICSALSAMHLRGVLTATPEGVHAVGRIDPRTDALEQAIHSCAAGTTSRRRLPFHRPVRTALNAMDDRLVSAGFLLPEERRRQIRRVGFWMLGVAVLGLVRVLAEVAAVQPLGFGVPALLVVTAVAVVQLGRAPRRSRHGDRVLARLRTTHPLGTGALRVAAPGLADEVPGHARIGRGDGPPLPGIG